MTDLNAYEMTQIQKYLFYGGVALIGAALSILFYRNVLFAVVILPFVEMIRGYVIQFIIEKRKRDYQIQFKDMLFMVSTAIGAGRSMKDAISETIPSLKEIYGEKSILAGELVKAYERMEVGGENDVDVLMDLGILSGMDDVIDFVTVYSICKSSGASLILALNKAASVIIDKMTIEREVSELVRRKESEGLIIFVMPIVVIIFLNLCAPDYIAPLYETIAGRLIMTAAVGANIGLYGMIQKITRVEI